MPVEYVRASYEVFEAANTELIGINEQVAQNEFGGRVAINISDEQHQGRVRLITVRMANEGTGAVIAEAGDLFFVRSAITVNVGDTDLTTDEANAVDAVIPFAAGDWSSYPTFAVATKEVYLPYVSSSDGKLYVFWYHRGATTFNDMAGDDERLRLNLNIERVT